MKLFAAAFVAGWMRGSHYGPLLPVAEKIADLLADGEVALDSNFVTVALLTEFLADVALTVCA